MQGRGIFVFALAGMSLAASAQVVTGIKAEYRHGQIFVTWHNIPGVDTGFYYVYCNKYPITSANIQTSTYLGRVPYNFGFDYRFTMSVNDGTPRRLVINDQPRTPLRWDQNVFVMTCTEDNQLTYFAVRCDYGHTSPNWMVIPGANALMSGYGIKQKVAPVMAYLQESGVNFPGSNNNEKMDVYIHFGGSVSTPYRPAMTNEGCLAFHFGIIRPSTQTLNNALVVKFHGGNGNFIANAMGVVIDSAWKINVDDWIPNFNFSATGTNTRWLGYHEKFDVYKSKVTDSPPTSGVVRAYTYRRIRWELDWIIARWPNAVDTNRIYLVGSSQGTAGVWAHCLIDPARFAAGSATDGRMQIGSEEDSNPACKYNDNGSARKETRVLWGHEDETNLETDVPHANLPGAFYRIYDLTNAAYMMETHALRGLPFLKALNGKEDKNACWEDKIPVYDAANQFHIGGSFFWDLRDHGGNNKLWPPLNTLKLLRHRSNKSFPAFSNCTCNGNPGDTDNPAPPYYDGDPVGAINGTVDWIDSTLIDHDTVWQVKLVAIQLTLLDGSFYPAVLPPYFEADVSIRRPQHFRNFADGTQLCWTNTFDGGMQSGTVTYQYEGTIPQPVTIPAVRIYPSGSLLKVALCNGQFQKSQSAGDPPAPIILMTAPGKMGKVLTDIHQLPANASAVLTDMAGRTLWAGTFPWDAGKASLSMPTADLTPGMYLLGVQGSGIRKVMRVIVPHYGF